jgi:hypothetical protein
LLNAQKPNRGKVPPPKAAEKGKDTKVDEKKSYVPPPPANGNKLPAPAGMPKVKEFPVSKEAPPAIMSFPNIKSAEPETKGGNAENAKGPANAEEVNDGFTPEERKKNELENNPAFKGYLMMKRMRIPLAQIRKKIRGDGLGFDPKDIDLWATPEEIKEADYMLI